MSIQQRGLIVPSASTTRYFLGDVHRTRHTYRQTYSHRHIDTHTQTHIAVSVSPVLIRDTKHSAVASHRCDLLLEKSVSCQLQTISHRYAHIVPVDLMNPQARFQSGMARHRLKLHSRSGGSGLLGHHHHGVWQHDRIVQAFVCVQYIIPQVNLNSSAAFFGNVTGLSRLDNGNMT